MLKWFICVSWLSGRHRAAHEYLMAQLVPYHNNVWPVFVFVARDLVNSTLKFLAYISVDSAIQNDLVRTVCSHACPPEMLGVSRP